MKANPAKLPKELKALAYKNPGSDILLPTGGKLYYIPGKGYIVHGYMPNNKDVIDYV